MRSAEFRDDLGSARDEHDASEDRDAFGDLLHPESHTCLRCEGAGEIGTSQDYWGNWNTEECRSCVGIGEVPLTPEEQRQQVEDERDEAAF